MPIFRNRQDAGQQLARHLEQVVPPGSQTVVLALPRGGVPVAAEIARHLQAPLDVLVVRKIGVPGQEELAAGAIASGDVLVLNQNIIDALQIPQDALSEVQDRETLELHRREAAYRGNRPPLEVTDHTVVVVDDGIATGATMRAAIRALQHRQARRIVVAVPHAPQDTLEDLQALGVETVCLSTPDPYISVGRWYQDFNQTSDDEVRLLLGEHHTG